MLIPAILLIISPMSQSIEPSTIPSIELGYTKKKRKAASAGGGRKFSSCKAARADGYTHMRRGRPGYSTALDRDGDGVACDKVK
jgi:Excalibur calcium-binding domain